MSEFKIGQEVYAAYRTKDETYLPEPLGLTPADTWVVTGELRVVSCDDETVCLDGHVTPGQAMGAMFGGLFGSAGNSLNFCSPTYVFADKESAEEWVALKNEEKKESTS
jgi:hypothetical protein